MFPLVICCNIYSSRYRYKLSHPRNLGYFYHEKTSRDSTNRLAKVRAKHKFEWLEKDYFYFTKKEAKMTTSAMLMQEIETLPEEAATEVLDFVVFLKKRRKTAKTTANGISLENAYGIFKGIDTHFNRDEEDRI